MWRLLLPCLVKYSLDHGDNISLLQQVEEIDDDNFDELVDMLTSNIFRDHIFTFIKENKLGNPNFHYWWGYMNMVCILLTFIRALALRNVPASSGGSRRICERLLGGKRF